MPEHIRKDQIDRSIKIKKVQDLDTQNLVREVQGQIVDLMQKVTNKEDTQEHMDEMRQQLGDIGLKSLRNDVLETVKNEFNHQAQRLETLLREGIQ
jgi:hypothetical protein